jgi:5-methylcytosine-specific restriction endonuclease McrA
MKAALRRLVRTRAAHCCEYCRLPEGLVPGLAFHIEHVVPKKHDGPDQADNLALACFWCNLHKGPNLTGIDPRSGRIVTLFHPRRQRWSRHFRWTSPVLVGRTATGRATVRVFAINLPHRIRIRQRLMQAGLFST